MIGRDKTTLYRLFKNNKIEYKKHKKIRIRWTGRKKQIKEKEKIKFAPTKIFKMRAKRKSEASKRYCRIPRYSKVEKYVLEKIKLYWSPSQISWRYEKEHTNETLSHQTIYSYLYNNHKNLIYKYFRRKGKKYRTRKQISFIMRDKKMISERPKIINERWRIWDWEGDTIVWVRNGSKAVLLTNVERKSGYLLCEKLENKTADKVLKITIKLFKQIPKEKKQTITYDNWLEFLEHFLIEKKTGLIVYFANAYHSRERWTNENTNWLIRQFLPKKTDFTKISEYKIKKIVKLINDRPRERLWFATPKEVF
jgi:IS30 family transposase